MNNRLKPVVRTVAGIISAKKIADDPTVTGYTIAVIPIDNNGSVMFEPIKVPIATPFERFAAVSATANSGSEVPPATITTPIANNEIFNFLPKLTDPLITISAPPTKINRPIIRYKRSTK